MKKIEEFTGLAPLTGGGKLNYYLWVDGEGALYVQMLETVVKGGNNSHNLFRISDFMKSLYSESAFRLPLKCRSPENAHGPSESNNEVDPGYLKAVIKHLIPAPAN